MGRRKSIAIFALKERLSCSHRLSPTNFFAVVTAFRLSVADRAGQTATASSLRSF
jgi:hypothetical protein